MSDPAPPPRASAAFKIILAFLLLIVATGALAYSLFQSGFLPFGQEEEVVVTRKPPARVIPPPPVDFAKIYENIESDRRPFVEAQETAAVKVYDEITPRDAAYYEDGRTAVRLMTIALSVPDQFGEAWMQNADFYIKAARQKGCRDPFLIAMCDVIYYEDRHSNVRDDAQGILDRMNNVFESAYPAVCKLRVGLGGLGNLCKMQSYLDRMRDDVTPLFNGMPELYGQVMEQFRIICRDSSPPERLAVWMAITFMDKLDRSTPLLERAGPDLEAALAQAGVSPGYQAYVEGDRLISLAWAARGSGWANSVTEEGWRVFGQRLQEAGELLNKASDQYPTVAAVPAAMITVELGQGVGAYRLNVWFQKAVAIDPGYYSAYSRKMNYLQPRWHGSVREVFQFGVECVQTGLWDKCIPLVLLDGLEGLEGRDDGSDKVFQVPEVWEAIRYTCTEFLERYPQGVCTRTRYLKFAVKAEKWEIAREQIQILGDYWDRRILDDKEYAQLKARVEQGG